MYSSDYFAINKTKCNPRLKLILRRQKLHLKMQDKYSTDWPNNRHICHGRALLNPAVRVIMLPHLPNPYQFIPTISRSASLISHPARENKWFNLLRSKPTCRHDIPGFLNEFWWRANGAAFSSRLQGPSRESIYLCTVWFMTLSVSEVRKAPHLVDL